MFEYNARVKRVVDADTLDIDLDLGFGVHKIERIRLARVDAWEMRGEERTKGIKATNFVEDLLHPVDTIMVKTQKDKRGKYGRYIAEVIVPTSREAVNLSDLLLAEGHAKVYDK